MPFPTQKSLTSQETMYACLHKNGRGTELHVGMPEQPSPDIFLN